MPGVSLRLPPEQLEHAFSAYAAAVRARRWRVALGLLCLLAAIALAGVAGEVDLLKFAGNIDRFPNYIRNLLLQLSWTNFGADVAEWFWNLDEWLKLLADTLLIAYLGTLLGAAGAFFLFFFAAAHLEPRNFIPLLAPPLLPLFFTVPGIVFALPFLVAVRVVGGP